jgi:alkyl hydroperoxide reductase subunit F
MYDLIVIGGGPAGLTSMIYAIRKRLNVLMISRDLGGKTQYHLSLPWIEQYQVIRGLEVVNKFKSELEYLDFARREGTVEKIGYERADHGAGASSHFNVTIKADETNPQGETLQAHAVILASGTRQKRLDVPGEKEYIMRGLCYSALSYAPLFIDRKTVVIGEGELAMRSASELATVADEVTVVCSSLDTPECMNSPLGRKLSQANNVKILTGHRVLEVKGDTHARTVLVKGENGGAGAIKELHADGIFVEMALMPNSGMVEGLAALDKQGRIIVDSSNRTNVAGLFAAGDVTNCYAEQVLVAIGEGAKAALSAYDYLLPIL